MKPETNKSAPILTSLLKELVYDEFALLEACQASAADGGADSTDRILQAGAAQVHVFDFDSLLRDLGAAPVTYSGCIRRSFRSLTGDWRAAARRLIDRYKRVLKRNDLPEKMRQILADNFAEHLTMSEQQMAFAA